MKLKKISTLAASWPKTERLPVLFVGHGSPMNGVEDNRYARAWADLGRRLPRPKAVLCVSAHWLTEGAFVHGAAKPKTIHDFWGFPPELYSLRYPCPGSPEAARQVQDAVGQVPVGWDERWGVDHGCWIVLRRMYPQADVPVFQLSIDATRRSRIHYAIGRELAPLRERGILIVGSGNLVHNLGLMEYEMDAKPFDWAVEHDARTADLIRQGDHERLIDYEKMGEAAALSIPTPDHWWPLLYALGAGSKSEDVSFPIEGISNASVSMRAVLIGR